MATYKNIIVLLTTLLLLASNVLADVRKQYTAKYLTGGVGGNGAIETRAGGRVSDEVKDLILEKTSEWSDGAYTARIGRGNILYVSIAQPVQTQAQANEAIQAMHELICQKVNECGQLDSDPGGAGPVQPTLTAGPVGRAATGVPSRKRWEA